MHFGRLAAAALAATLGGAAPGWGAVLYTPNAPAFNIDESLLFCQVRNVGSGARTVTIQHLGNDDEVLGSVTRNLAAGQAASELSGSLLSTYCRFDVNGGADTVRGVGLYWNGSRYTLALPAR